MRRRGPPRAPSAPVLPALAVLLAVGAMLVITHAAPPPATGLPVDATAVPAATSSTAQAAPSAQRSIATTVTPAAAHIEDASQTAGSNVGGYAIACADGPAHYNSLGQYTPWQCQGPHGTTVYGTTEAITQARAQAAWDGCPPAIHGTLTLLDNRIRLQVGLAGPKGTVWFTAIIDTGAFRTNLPNSVYQAAGYGTAGSQTEFGVVPGASSQANVYSVAADAFLVMDQGQVVPLVRSTERVDTLGAGSMHLVGPDVLRMGARLSLTGSQWTLQPECFADNGGQGK